MTVRWKPLLVLSGVFAAIAVVGVIAMAFTLAPRGLGRDPRRRPAPSAAARQYEKAEIHYKQALQMDGKNPAIHEEMAALYADWADHAPAEKQAELRASRFASLAEAANHGKTLQGAAAAAPRRGDGAGRGPREPPLGQGGLALEPENADAHYVLAAAALDDRSTTARPRTTRRSSPRSSGTSRRSKTAKAPAVRIAWIKARLAQVSGDAAGLRSRPGQGAGPVAAGRRRPGRPDGPGAAPGPRRRDDHRPRPARRPGQGLAGRGARPGRRARTSPRTGSCG